MPTFYAPGKRKYRKGGKVYTNRTFVVRGRIDGIEYEYTTKSVRKKGAGGAEAEWEDYALKLRAGSRPVPTRESATFEDAALMYRQARDPSKNESRYVRNLEGYFAGKALASFLPQDLIAAAHALYPDAKPQTKNRQAIRPAAAVLHLAAKNDLCDWLRPISLEQEEPERPSLTLEQGEFAIAAAKKAGRREMVALLTTLVYQGWRITETLMTRRANVNWKGATVKRWVTKSKRWVDTPILPEVLKAWRSLPIRNVDDRIFSIPDRHRFYAEVDDLGLPFHLRPHMHRRGIVRELKGQGVDALDIAEACAWENERSVKVYMGKDIDRARRTLEKLRGAVRGKAKKSA